MSLAQAATNNLIYVSVSSRERTYASRVLNALLGVSYAYSFSTRRRQRQATYAGAFVDLNSASRSLLYRNWDRQAGKVFIMRGF